MSGITPLFNGQTQWPGPGGNNDPQSGMNDARGRFHAGNDYYTPIGTPLNAQGDAIVRHVGAYGVGGTKDNYGNYVVLQYTSGPLAGDVFGYAHLASSLIKVGQKLTDGQRFATSGATGTMAGLGLPGTPPHVHMEATSLADDNKVFGAHGGELIGGGKVGDLTVYRQVGRSALLDPSKLYADNGHLADVPDASGNTQTALPHATYLSNGKLNPNRWTLF